MGPVQILTTGGLKSKEKEGETHTRSIWPLKSQPYYGGCNTDTPYEEQLGMPIPLQNDMFNTGKIKQHEEHAARGRVGGM